MPSIDAPGHKSYTSAKSFCKLPGFRSFKTRGTILYSARWHHDLLIQLTLNSSVSSINSDNSQNLYGKFRLVVSCDEEVRSLIAMSDEDVDELQSSSDPLLVRRSDVLSEPSLSNARAIWSSRRTTISPGDRLRVLERLSAYPDGLALSQLTNCIRNSSADPIDAVLALTCLGLSILDVGSPLCPETIVRRNARSDQKGAPRQRSVTGQIRGLLGKIEGEKLASIDDRG